MTITSVFRTLHQAAYEMIPNCEISLATPADLPGIVALQELNLPEKGGALSVRQSAEWFRTAMLEMPLVVARRDGDVVGYVVATSMAAQAHLPIIQAMVRTYDFPPDCYLSGPICVAEAERGKGLSGDLIKHLRAKLPGRAAVAFITASNTASLRAHEKIGMSRLGPFTSDGVQYVALIRVP